jgi:uncharacterized protein (DUF433 family)
LQNTQTTPAQIDGCHSKKAITVLLENYFEFLSPTDIRVKGHRIGIDTVLSYNLEGYTPEEIAANLLTLSLEEIHATITYYLHNRSQLDIYMAELDTWREQHYQESRNNPSPVTQKLRAIKAANARQAS